jgi:plasmid stabilization system protein ParE
MKYHLLALARSDLRNIEDWVLEQFGESHAEAALDKLFHAFELLAKHQQIGIARPDVTDRPVLFFSSSLNWIVYEPGTPLLIHRVLSGRMDIQKLLDE